MNQKLKTVDNDTQGAGVEAVSLPLRTFRPTHTEVTTRHDEIDCCELGIVANMLGPGFVQTSRLLSWGTGATSPRHITDDVIAGFNDLLRRIDRRFGSHPGHLCLSPEEAVAQAVSTAAAARDVVTVARHLNRLPALRDHTTVMVEHRLSPIGRVSPSAVEIDQIDGWSRCHFFVLVEKHGRIVEGGGLQAFEEIVGARQNVGPKLFDHAMEALRGHERISGRAFVASRHRDEVSVVPGFWALVDADKPTVDG